MKTAICALVTRNVRAVQRRYRAATRRDAVVDQTLDVVGVEAAEQHVVELARVHGRRRQRAVDRALDEAGHAPARHDLARAEGEERGLRGAARHDPGSGRAVDVVPGEAALRHVAEENREVDRHRVHRRRRVGRAGPGSADRGPEESPAESNVTVTGRVLPAPPGAAADARDRAGRRILREPGNLVDAPAASRPTRTRRRSCRPRARPRGGRCSPASRLTPRALSTGTPPLFTLNPLSGR